MGRTLQNTMVNLGLQNACDEAIYQVASPRRLSLMLFLNALPSNAKLMAKCSVSQQGTFRLTLQGKKTTFGL